MTRGAWWTAGTMDTQFFDEKDSSGAAREDEGSDPTTLLAKLRAEVAAGTEAALVDVARVRWDGLDARIRRRAWAFMIWLVARHPDRWLQLGTELYVDDARPEQVAATFRKVLGRDLADVDAEWREWVRSGSSIGQARGFPE